MGIKKCRGFTIIEVSLVLAIGALILLMVFIALPSVQRAQRDAKRRDDVSLVLKAVRDYQSAHRGALPNDFFIHMTPDKNGLLNYLPSSFGKDPDGEDYTMEIMPCGTSVNGQACSLSGWTFNANSTPKDNDYAMLVLKSASCNDDNSMAVKSQNTRNVAVLYATEIGGVFCAN